MCVWMHFNFSQTFFCCVCKINKTVNMVELNSFENEMDSLKSLFFCHIHLALLQTGKHLLFFHLSSFLFNTDTWKNTIYLIKSTLSVCLCLAVYVSCWWCSMSDTPDKVLGQSWINCPLISANRHWLKSWGPKIISLSTFHCHFKIQWVFLLFK